MYYSIRHFTKFRYSAHVSESLMEARMQPRSDGPQRCLSFQLMVQPKTRIQFYRDYLGNTVHHFDVPGRHKQLSIVADALVDVQPAAPLPESLGRDAWEQLDEMIAAGDYIEMLMPSHFGQSTELLEQFAEELGVESREKARQRDPLEFVLELNALLYSKISYVPKSTRVDSPIDHALESRQGVCQDFAHIMIGLTRPIGIPCRYVSGYLFHKAGETRSA
jgi:transglutaminase-like putative cysteine protease